MLPRKRKQTNRKKKRHTDAVVVASMLESVLYSEEIAQRILNSETSGDDAKMSFVVDKIVEEGIGREVSILSDKIASKIHRKNCNVKAGKKGFRISCGSDNSVFRSPDIVQIAKKNPDLLISILERVDIDRATRERGKIFRKLRTLDEQEDFQLF